MMNKLLWKIIKIIWRCDEFNTLKMYVDSILNEWSKK